MKPVIARHSWKWEDSRGGRWIVHTTWAEVNGRAECVGVELRSWIQDYRSRLEPMPDGLKPVTTTVWRELNVGSAINKLRNSKAAQLRKMLAHSRQIPARRVEEMKKSLERHAAPRIGRPPEHGADHFERVARVYAKAWARGRAPTKAVSEHFHISRSQAAKWVQRARGLGFLSPTTSGKAGGIQPKEDS